MTGYLIAGGVFFTGLMVLVGYACCVVAGWADDQVERERAADRPDWLWPVRIDERND